MTGPPADEADVSGGADRAGVSGGAGGAAGHRRALRPGARRPAPGAPGRHAAGPGRRPGLVRARFRLSELPGVTVTAPAAGAVPGRGAAAGAAAARALAQAGLGHLGGHLVLRTYGAAPPARALTRAARRAVAAALAGGPGAALPHGPRPHHHPRPHHPRRP
ncbi:hypothetical protein [Streptomyces sp. NPDC051567]|uniref:hypothetical protein n=1 Tax=Streptomyces sp. NPDC051567 TaxID=3365660 RepID=UPI0037A43E54